MLNRSFRKTLLMSAMILGVFSLAPGESCLAKEDTAHLVFKKKAVSSLDTETYTYTVKKSDKLLDIVRNELGITKHRLSLIRQYNPEIANTDKIRPGQKLILPLGPRKAFLQATGKAEGSVPSPEPESSKGIIQSDEGVPMASRLALMQAILGRMNASMTTSGRYIVPLPEIGQITVDCSLIPVIEFDDGSVTFLDFRRQIPDSIRRLVRKHWANYSVITVSSKEATLSILARAVHTSRTYSMTRPKGSSLFGQKPLLRLPADWMIARKSGGAKESPVQAVMTLKSAEARLPGPIAGLLAKRQLVATEIEGNTVLPPLPKAPAEATTVSVPRLKTHSQTELVFDLLNRLGFQPVRNSEIQIFDSRKDGFNLSVTAEIQVQNGPKRVLFVSKKLPEQFMDILQGRDTEVAALQENASPAAAIGKALTALHVPYTTIPYAFPVSRNPDLAAVKVIFPTIRVLTTKGEPCYLIDFDMDADLFALLHKQMEFHIIAY